MAAKVIHQSKWGVHHVSVTRLWYHVQILTSISPVVSEIINLKQNLAITIVIQYGRQTVNPTRSVQIDSRQAYETMCKISAQSMQWFPRYEYLKLYLKHIRIIQYGRQSNPSMQMRRASCIGKQALISCANPHFHNSSSLGDNELKKKIGVTIIIQYGHQTVNPIKCRMTSLSYEGIFRGYDKTQLN